MKPATDEQIAATLEWLRGTMEQSTGFLQEQAPLYVNELLEYGVFVNTLVLIVSAIFTLILAAAMIAVVVKTWRDENDAALCLMVAIIPGLLLAPSVGAACITGSELYKIKHAPRVYIMEHIAP